MHINLILSLIFSCLYIYFCNSHFHATHLKKNSFFPLAQDALLLEWFLLHSLFRRHENLPEVMSAVLKHEIRFLYENRLGAVTHRVLRKKDLGHPAYTLLEIDYREVDWNTMLLRVPKHMGSFVNSGANSSHRLKNLVMKFSFREIVGIVLSERAQHLNYLLTDMLNSLLTPDAFNEQRLEINPGGKETGFLEEATMTRIWQVGASPMRVPAISPTFILY